jgi:hypothetical protein
VDVVRGITKLYYRKGGRRLQVWSLPGGMETLPWSPLAFECVCEYVRECVCEYVRECVSGGGNPAYTCANSHVP